jgi:hypothetical protein
MNIDPRVSEKISFVRDQISKDSWRCDECGETASGAEYAISVLAAFAAELSNENSSLKAKNEYMLKFIEGCVDTMKRVEGTGVFLGAIPGSMLSESIKSGESILASSRTLQ